MATKEHSTLTGASLHEPKGVAAAAANRVYVSDGLGSGSWSTVGINTITSSIFPFYMHVQDQKPSGTTGGTFSSGSWRTRTLNTVVTNTIPGASLSTNQIILPAGTYDISARSAAAQVYGNKIRLRNITTSTTTIVGFSNDFNKDSFASGYAALTGRFTLAVTTTFEIQHWGSNTVSSTGFGYANSTGEIEIYSDVEIRSVPNG